MNTNEPRDRDVATVSYVETSLATLADALRQACAVIDRWSAEQLRTLLAIIDKSMSPQPAWENAAGHVWLSPKYFTLADEVNERRIQLACALVVAEINDRITLTKTLLKQIRQRAPEHPDPKFVFDNLTQAICGALDMAEVPCNAPWREIIERAVYPLSSLWDEARALIPETPKNED